LGNGDVTAEAALHAVLARAERAGWSGPDPYDGLLSTVGRIAVPFGAGARIVVTQAALRSSTVRRLLRPPASVNPKGLGLFLGAVASGRDSLGASESQRIARELVALLEFIAVRRDRWIAWGYPFPWQSRFFFAPAGTPNAVVTATVGWNLLDWAEAMGNDTAGALGVAAARFLSYGLHHTATGDGAAALSYTANDRARIVNVSMLGARLLARAAPLAGTDGPRMQDQAQRLLRFALEAQRDDGSWTYAVEARGGWIDSFHTGFVLEALLDLRALGHAVPEDALARGFAFYERFFDGDGGARFSTRPDAPYDAHSAAQGIITYAALAGDERAGARERGGARAAARRIASWSLERLWLPDKGHFAYRISRGRRSEQEYTRWVQAWMALGMGAAITVKG